MGKLDPTTQRFCAESLNFTRARNHLRCSAQRGDRNVWLVTKYSPKSAPCHITRRCNAEPWSIGANSESLIPDNGLTRSKLSRSRLHAPNFPINKNPIAIRLDNRPPKRYTSEPRLCEKARNILYCA